jgi:hypothetical protein
MKRTKSILQLTVICLSVIFTNHLFAQEKKERVSPPAKVSSIVGGSTITINYGQPSVKGRKVWGELVPYNKVWRTGANEATTFETTKDIKVEGVLLPAGKYALFTIPGENEWTFIFNKTASQWGAYSYDEKQDQLRIKVKPVKTSALNEQLTFYIENNKALFRWEYLEAGFKISE